MEDINEQLAAQNLNLAIEQIEFFTIGGGRPVNRIHQQEFRWVANDERRLADGENITYLVDQSDGATTSGLTSAQTEAAVDRALDTGKVRNVSRRWISSNERTQVPTPTSSTLSSALAVLVTRSWQIL